MANEYLAPVTYIPSRLLILNIARTFPMLMTLFVPPGYPVANTYLAGMLLRLYVPVTYGMRQANGLIGKILLVTGLDVALDIDARYFDPYVIPSGSVEAPASVVVFGSRNTLFSNDTRNLPFQTLNNIGN